MALAPASARAPHLATYLASCASIEDLSFLGNPANPRSNASAALDMLLEDYGCGPAERGSAKMYAMAAARQAFTEAEAAARHI